MLLKRLLIGAATSFCLFSMTIASGNDQSSVSAPTPSKAISVSAASPSQPAVQKNTSITPPPSKAISVSAVSPSQPAVQKNINITPQTSLPSAYAVGSNAVSQKKQVWNLQNTDIRAVIQSIARLTGKSFIVDPRVQGKVTIISNTPMTKDESYHVFLSLLQILGYAAVPSGNVVKILPTFNAKQTGAPLVDAKNPGQGDQVVVRLVTVNNVSATDLVSVLRPLMSETSSVSAYTPSNALILAGYADNINKLVKVVQNLDSNNASQIQVVPLQHADATKIVAILQSLQQSESAKGRASNVSYAADAGSNGILISGSLNAINRAKQLIAKLDSDKGMSGNTKVIRLKYLKAKDLAATLQKVAQATITAQGGSANAASDVSIQPEIDNNTLLVHAPAAEVQSLEQIIKELDTRPSQVLIQAVIARVDQSTLSHLGIIWGTAPSADQLKAVAEAAGSMVGANGLPTGFQEGMGTIPGGKISVILKALNSNTSSNVLSTPSLVVLNNEKASITSGENRQVANREYATTNTGGAGDDAGVPFQTFQTQKADLVLTVMPQISPDKTVRLKIDQKDDSFDTPADSGNTRPAMDTTDINTSVLVNSGDILVLGGLIKNDHQKQEHKVPILGDIPILGNLFRYRDKSNERKSLMIFIRPIILTNKKQNHRVSMLRYHYMRQQQIQAEAQEGQSNKLQSVLPALGNTPEVQLPKPF